MGVFDLWVGATFKKMVRRAATGIDADIDMSKQLRLSTPFLDHRSRLATYDLLHSITSNVSRVYLGPADAKKLREYGDASLIVKTATSALLGDTQKLVIKGSGDETNSDALALQQHFDDWSQTEQLEAKMLTAEGDAEELGDGIYALHWDARKRKVRLRTYNPGFYFPVLDDPHADFPTTVHMAWEFEDVSDPTAPKRKLRRQTWELRRIQTSAYPWGKSDEACYFTDATWVLGDIPAHERIETLSYRHAQFERDELGTPVFEIPLGIDDIPIVHIPNSITGEHFGHSVLMAVLQLLEDIASADSSLALTAQTTGFPVITLSGTRAEGQSLAYGPGTVWELGDNGRMDVLHTSDSLLALEGYRTHQRKLLSTNARIPQAALGNIDPSQVPSGFALALGFAPMGSMNREQRLVRRAKHPLIPKLAWKLALAAGIDLPKKWPGAEIELGAYLPNDLSEMVNMVNTLIEHKLISRESALKILKAAGLDVDDIPTESAAIRSTDFTGAQALSTAVGDPLAAAEYLRLKDAYKITVVPPPEPPSVSGALGTANPSPTAPGAKP